MFVRKWDVLYLSFEELHILYSGFLLVFVCQSEHLIGHVKAVGFTVWGYPPSRKQNIYATPASQIQHNFTGRQGRHSNRITTPQGGLRGSRRQLTQFPS